MALNHHLRRTATKANRIVSAFANAGRKILDRRRLPDDNGEHLGFHSGSVVLVYDAGATRVTGENQAEARQILERTGLLKRDARNRWKRSAPPRF